MILVLLFLGIIIVVAALRNSQGALFAALYEDVPGFVVWAAAIFAIGAVGFIPGLKPVSRGILALVIVVIVLRNYKQIITGFENVWTKPPAAASGATGQTNGTSDTALPSAFGGSGATLDSLFHDPLTLSMAGVADYATSAGSDAP